MNPLTIEIVLTPETRALMKRMENLPFILRKGIAAGMDKAGALMVSDIQAKRLSGKGPYPVDEGRLGQVTRRLRTSVRFTRAQIAGDLVHQTMGTNVSYAGVHEFGFNGQVHVPGFTRRQRSRDRVAVENTTTKTGKPKKRKVVVASGIAFVKAHTRWMQIPARAPFGHGVADNTPTYTREIGTAVREVARTYLGTGAEPQS